jgi:hypothetical protein
MKLNILLGKTDYLASTFSKMLKDYIGFFKTKQGAFLGEKITFSPKEGTVDEPSKRKNSVVQTTVGEKFEWFKENSKSYVDALFSVEATNASGTAKAELLVDGKSWGTFTSLELLRLKGILENNDLKGVLENIPVRSDSLIWEKNTSEQYEGRDIFQTPIVEGTEKTTVKESYILEDPNLSRIDPKNYSPQLGIKNTVMELGDYTHQKFSGELSQRKKAEILKRRSSLLVGVIEALKECNNCEVVKSELNSEKIFGYLLGD